MSDDDNATDELFVEFRRTGKRSIRNELVERHTGLAVHIANRHTSGSVPDDDLRQVALLALVRAVDRFEPERGVPFSAFAGRTIEGELKRHFRDRTWSLGVPRSAKELYLSVRRANEELAQRLGRSPSVDDVAAHLGISRDDVITGLSAAMAKSADTLEAPTSSGRPMARPDSALTTQETGYGHIDDQSAVATLLEALPERERAIVKMRFYDNLSQQEIAEQVGISQMHVSRLLRKSFEMMRTAAEEAEHDIADPPDG